MHFRTDCKLHLVFVNMHRRICLLFCVLLTTSATDAPPKPPPRNFYTVLDVATSATKREIKKAYRKQAVLLHPDKHKPEEKSHYEQLFIELAEAYSVLSDEQTRLDYDSGKYNTQFNNNFDEVFKTYGYDGVQDTAANWLALSLTLSLLFLPML